MNLIQVNQRCNKNAAAIKTDQPLSGGVNITEKKGTKINNHHLWLDRESFNILEVKNRKMSHDFPNQQVGKLTLYLCWLMNQNF